MMHLPTIPTGHIIFSTQHAIHSTTADLWETTAVTPRNGFELVHGFSYEFRNIQCLQYSVTQNSCSPIHHQINLIFQHSHNITTPHSFPLPTIICYFLYSVPGAHGLKAQSSLETYKPHGHILKITQLMTDHPHSTWNTSHMLQMTQKVTMQHHYL